MLCPRFLVLAVLVASLLASVSAHPSQKEHSRRVSACSNKLNNYGVKTAKKFCVAYLNGRKPASPTTTLTKTTTSTLAAATTTIPVTITSTATTTESETTTTTLSEVTTTTTTATVTTTPTSTDSETATETETVTVTDDGSSQRRRRMIEGRSSIINPVPLVEENEKRSALTSQQSSSIYGSFLDSEITDACLLLIYGRYSYPARTVTATATATSTPAAKTATATATATVTDTETDTATETETTFTATSTETETSTVEGEATTVTTTVATTTVTSTTTVAAAPTATTGAIKVTFSDGSADKYLVTATDFTTMSRLLYLTTDVASAAQITFDASAGILALASDSTFTSNTIGTTTNYYFRLAQPGAATTQRQITCSLASGTKQLSCATSEGYTVLQSCSGYFTIAQTSSCGSAVSIFLV